MRFKVTANITGGRTGVQKQAAITRPAASEREARDKFHRDMRLIGYTTDGDVSVERED